ncbi:MAG: molybdopterin-binding oxidoreductase [Chitinophagaceae bacterium]
MKEQLISEQKLRRKNILSFLFFVFAFSAGICFWFWLKHRPADGGLLGGIPTPLRTGLNVNERLFSAVFNKDKQVPTYAKSEAVPRVKVNGDVGMSTDEFNVSDWKLAFVKPSGDTAFFTMDDIKKLPKTEIIFDFKCIEGWSQKTWWGGVRFSDFLNYYHLNDVSEFKYAGLMTPDEEYYVGIDMPSMLQSQTILCYEMNGQPLPMNQGYPLRLIIPVKYGIKHLKRIGTIFFSNEKPADYWAERGYDYYAGH